MFGNGLTMVAIIKFDFLKSATNVFIFSLALNDFQIGLMTPLSIIIHYTRPQFTFEFQSFNNCNLNTDWNGKRSIAVVSNVDSTDFLNWTLGCNNMTDAGKKEHFKLILYDHSYFAKWSRLCLAKEITNSLQSFGSITGIFLIAVDRFIFIEKPLRYHDIMTVRKALFSCTLMWILSIVVGPVPVPFFVNPVPTEVCDTSIWSSVYFYGVIAPLFGIITTANIIMYLRIAYVAFSKSKTTVTPFVLTDRDSSEISKQVKKGTKITKMLSIVLGLYFVLYLPSILFGSFGQENDSDVLIVVKYVSFILFFTAMCVNPVIYAWKSKDFKRAFSQILFFRKNIQVNINTEFSKD